MDNKQKIEKLKELVVLAKNGLTKDEFVRHFQVVIDLVKQLQVTNKQALDEIERKYNQVVVTTLATTRNVALEYCQEELVRMARIADNKLANLTNGLDGQDGQDADSHMVAVEASDIAVQKLQSLIPTIETLAAQFPALGTEVRNALELLQGKERLAIDAIDGLTEKLIELERLHKNGTGAIHALGTSGGGRIVKSYDLSPKLDGVTKVFSLPAMWRIITVVSSSFPNALQQTTDWVYDAVAHTITFTAQIDAATTLAAGQTVTILYGE